LKLVTGLLTMILLVATISSAQSSTAPAAAAPTAPAQNSAAPAAAAPIAPAQSSPPPGQAAPAETKSSTESHPVDWAPRQYVDLWNNDIWAKDTIEKMRAMFNPVVVMHSRSVIVPLNPGVVREVISSWHKSMPDLHFTIEDTIIEGNKVVLRLNFTGTYTKLLWAQTLDPASYKPPKKIRSDEILIFNIKNGKISEIWEEYNETIMRFQMGSTWCPQQLGAGLSGAPKPPPEAPSAPSAEPPAEPPAGPPARP
jgi:predicted ester cyclase